MECRRSGTSELQKIKKLSIIGHFDDFQEIWALPTRVQNLKVCFLKFPIVHVRPISSITELHRSRDIVYCQIWGPTISCFWNIDFMKWVNFDMFPLS